MMIESSFWRESRAACLLVALALGMPSMAGGPTAAEHHRHAVPAAIIADEVRIVSTEFKFAPLPVRVVAGQKITLILDNSRAETEHGIFVPAFGLRMLARAGEVVQTTYVFDTPGEYEFVCDLPGHHEAGMEGKLIVADAGGDRPQRTPWAGSKI